LCEGGSKCVCVRGKVCVERERGKGTRKKEKRDLKE